MRETERMSITDQKLMLVALLRAIMQVFPQHKKHICKLVDCIQSGAAPKNSLKTTLNVLVGRDNMHTISTLVRDSFIADKIKKRTLSTSRCLCHGCFSYPADIKCPSCGHITFCYGCYDYGECMRCAERIVPQTQTFSNSS